MLTALRWIGFSPNTSMRSTRRADAVRLVADQFGEFAVGGADRGLQQLRGAADAGQRVFHLMRQDRRHAGHAARRAAECQLAVQRTGRRGVLHHQQHRAGLLRQRRALHGDARLVQPRALQRHVVVGDRRLGLPDLLDQREQRVVRWHQVAQPDAAPSEAADMPRNCCAARLTWRKRFSRIEQDDRDRKRAEHGAASVGARPLAARQQARGAGHDRTHAASAVIVSSRVRAAAWRRDAAGDQRIVERVDQPQHAGGIRQPVHRGAEFGRAGQAARVPGQVLARQPHPGVVPKRLSIA